MVLAFSPTDCWKPGLEGKIAMPCGNCESSWACSSGRVPVNPPGSQGHLGARFGNQPWADFSLKSYSFKVTPPSPWAGQIWWLSEAEEGQKGIFKVVGTGLNLGQFWGPIPVSELRGICEASVIATLPFNFSLHHSHSPPPPHSWSPEASSQGIQPTMVT